MQGSNEQAIPVKAKAVLIDPESMTVVWMNESAAGSLPDGDVDSVAEVAIEQAVPMAAELGVHEALRDVADTGVARHLQTDVVSTTRGSVAMVVSIYRLPNAALLVVMENAWQPGHGSAGDGSPPRHHRRNR